jgi:UDP-glucose 4-epimerase
MTKHSQRPACNILVTGANGFIGRHLVNRLLLDGHRMITYDIQTFKTCNPINRLISVNGDIVEGGGFDTINWESLDVVVHLAAAGVKATRRNWPECIDVNVVGTSLLLQRLQACKQGIVFLYPSTFYEDFVNSISALRDNPYFRTKYAATLLVKSWYRLVPHVSMRFCNVFQLYGGGDDPDNILNYVTRCLLKGEPALLGSGTGKRDWIFIEDAVEALVKVIAADNPGVTHYDIGTGSIRSIKDVVTAIADLINAPISLLQFDAARDRGDTQIMAFATRFVRGWQPHISLDEGLNRLIQATKESFTF